MEEEFPGRFVEVNGINMYVVDKGHGPVVLLLHGFPEFWYSWRYQIRFLSNNGYRAVAPDLRGCGRTNPVPSSSSSYTCFHLVGDIIALIDSLGVDKVFVVGHDWGAIIGWYLCLFRPERVKAFVCLSVPFGVVCKRDPHAKTVENFRALYGEDYYVCRFQEPGVMEEQMAAAGTDYVTKNILTTREPGPIILPKGEYGTGFNPNMPDRLPSWLSSDDLYRYIHTLKDTGFTGILNYYRALDLNWELTAPWSRAGISKDVPVRFITGTKDLVYTIPEVQEYIEGDEFKRDVPNLEIIRQPDVAHFNNQEAAEDTNRSIYEFISRFH